ncbi:hypothetical protein Q8F55_007997 [Vanrija albida]|uniref:Asl1-like glycosyl hydrolase catalytic domain-containing protein n=1 Tax=Vanrija albida TaxID=181172 RepID=A0ABR3PV27_9TREE
MRTLLAALLTLTLLAPALGTPTPPTPHRPASKRGLSWANAHWVPIAPFDAPSTPLTAQYNWAPAPSANTSYPFVPMLWGCDAAHVAAWDSVVAANFSGTRLTPDRAPLAFNEPELGVQANCSPKDAAAVWVKHFEPLKAWGYRLGTPAVTMGPEGKAWLLQWFAECAGACNPDFLAVHWYDMSFASLVSVLQGYYAAFDLPIWLTEYALTYFGPGSPPPLASVREVDEFMRASMAWLDAQDWVERYFWFGAMYDMQGVNPANSLLDPAGAPSRSGQLSPLGSVYLAPANSTRGTATAHAASAARRRRRRHTLANTAAICIVAWWYL